MRKPRKPAAAKPYYPSQQRGHQCLVLDDRTVIGAPTMNRPLI